MIQLAEVHKRYGRARARSDAPEALAGISLEIPQGSVTAVVGPNGAGKTTLFGITLGFLMPSTGEATIAGGDPRDWVNANGAGFLPERFTPPAAWRVEETIASLARMDGLGRGAQARAREILERFGLASYAGRRLGTLSRGLLQRVGLAQALVARHRLIVLDEPTNGLDPLGRAAFRAALAALRQHDATVLVASHDIAEIERIADRVVLLEDGRVRDVLPARTAADYTRYRLRLAAPETVLRSAFPDAVALAVDVTQAAGEMHNVELTEPALVRGRDDADAQDGKRSPIETFAVSVATVDELNHRLAQVIAAGGLVYEIAPLTDALADRLERLRNASDDASRESR